ncbi:MAG TPA: hypothetical protein PLI07_12960, partial [Candidatus Hydrogenedentes bacterium]|nr:hypothetical protein [Candidatus Hydrogenedentota bacterium]
MEAIRGDAVSRLEAAVNSLKKKGGVLTTGEKPLGGFSHSGELIWWTRETGDHAGAREEVFSLESAAAPEWPESEPAPELAELERAVVDLKMEIALLRGQEGWLLSTNEDLIERLASARSEKRRQAESLGEAHREINRLRQALAESEEGASRFKR